MPLMAIDVNAAIEVAEHNGWWDAYGNLTVFDTRRGRTDYGFRLELSKGATAVGGWIGRCYDRVGNRAIVWHADRATAAQNAVDGYFAKIS